MFNHLPGDFLDSTWKGNAGGEGIAVHWKDNTHATDCPEKPTRKSLRFTSTRAKFFSQLQGRA